MIRRVGARLIIAGLALSTVAACGTTERHFTPPPVTITSMITTVITPTTNVTTTTTTTSTRTSPAGIPLYEQFEAQSSDGPNGKPVNATLAGTNYPTSTGMWVGCSGKPATTAYRLGRKFARLQAVAGLQPHTPAGLAVKATISVNGNAVKDFTIRRTETERLDLDLTGADSLVVTAIAVDGSLCTMSGTAYGALGDAMLTPTGL